MHSECIWTDLKLQRWILTVFEKIGNCRNLLKTMSLKHALWRYLKLQRKNESNVSKACTVTVFETNWNCREKMKTMSLKHAFRRLPLVETVWTAENKTMSLKHAFWWYFKRFGTAENFLKTISLKNEFWQCLKGFGTAEKRIWKQCI